MRLEDIELPGSARHEQDAARPVEERCQPTSDSRLVICEAEPHEDAGQKVSMQTKRSENAHGKPGPTGSPEKPEMTIEEYPKKFR